MLRFLRLLFIGLIAVIFLFLALSNRESVTLRLMPSEIGALIGWEGTASLPLFLALFAAVAFGILIGFVWEWFREMRLRGAAKVATKRVDRLERELAVLKDAHNVAPKDEVLAILDSGDKK